MKVASLLVILSMAAGAAAADTVKAGYWLDLTRSGMVVEARVLGAPVSAGFASKWGTLRADAAGRAGALDLHVDTSSVYASVGWVEERLKGPSFLDVQTYKAGRLTIEALQLPLQAGSVRAAVTLRGTTKHLDLAAGRPECDPPGPVRQICRIVLSGIITLAEFGMGSALPGIPRTARLVLTLAIGSGAGPDAGAESM